MCYKAGSPAGNLVPERHSAAMLEKTPTLTTYGAKPKHFSGGNLFSHFFAHAWYCSSLILLWV